MYHMLFANPNLFLDIVFSMHGLVDGKLALLDGHSSILAFLKDFPGLIGVHVTVLWYYKVLR